MCVTDGLLNGSLQAKAHTTVTVESGSALRIFNKEGKIKCGYSPTLVWVIYNPTRYLKPPPSP